MNQLSVEPERWETTIERAILRENEPPRVGVNIKIMRFLAKKNALLLVHCLDPLKDREYQIDSYFIKKVKKTKLASKFEGGEPLVICEPKL